MSRKSAWSTCDIDLKVRTQQRKQESQPADPVDCAHTATHLSSQCQKPTSGSGKQAHYHILPIPAHALTLAFPSSQNNDSLSALSSKVSALRSVTIDIYDNARDQGVIDSTTDTFSNMTTSLKGSARRLGVMASQGNKVAVLKLAGVIITVVLVAYWLLSWVL